MRRTQKDGGVQTKLTIRPGFSRTVQIFNDVFRKNQSSPRAPICPVLGLMSRICPDIDKVCYFTVRMLILTRFCWAPDGSRMWRSHPRPELRCPNYGHLSVDSKTQAHSLTDERLKQSTLEDAHDAFNGETQRTIVWVSQATVVFFEQLQRSVRFCTTCIQRRRSLYTEARNSGVFTVQTVVRPNRARPTSYFWYFSGDFPALPSIAIHCNDSRP